MKRFAVIDLGTNTFHLLIAGRKSEHEFIEIYRERTYVRITKEGSVNFSQAAMKRAIDAMRKFHQITQLFETIEVRAFATAAFRNAHNADVLIRRIYREFQIQVEIISGEEEARLIYEGVKFSGALRNQQNLIMDIGGGSVEFVICNSQGISWSTSLPLGVSILKNKFHTEEPISKMDICSLRLHLKKVLQPLIEQISDVKFTTLIGSSGTFDVIADGVPIREKVKNCQLIYKNDFAAFASDIIELNLEERIAHPAIPENRADLIVVALILIDEILSLQPYIQYISVSPYALKEGMAMEMNYKFEF